MLQVVSGRRKNSIELNLEGNEEMLLMLQWQEGGRNVFAFNYRGKSHVLIGGVVMKDLCLLFRLLQLAHSVVIAI